MTREEIDITAQRLCSQEGFIMQSPDSLMEDVEKENFDSGDTARVCCSIADKLERKARAYRAYANELTRGW